MSNDTDFDDEYHEGEDNSGWWDLKLASLVIIVGALLLLFPEPFTSVVGIILIIGGVVFAVVDEFGEHLSEWW